MNEYNYQILTILWFQIDNLTKYKISTYRNYFDIKISNKTKCDFKICDIIIVNDIVNICKIVVFVNIHKSKNIENVMNINKIRRFKQFHDDRKIWRRIRDFEYENWTKTLWTKHQMRIQQIKFQ